MGVVEGEKGAVLVIIHQRRVQRTAAEDTGANKVPERRANDVGIGGGLSRCPRDVHI
jgi:hypothetical protein